MKCRIMYITFNKTSTFYQLRYSYFIPFWESFDVVGIGFGVVAGSVVFPPQVTVGGSPLIINTKEIRYNVEIALLL